MAKVIWFMDGVCHEMHWYLGNGLRSVSIEKFDSYHSTLAAQYFLTTAALKSANENLYL